MNLIMCQGLEAGQCRREMAAHNADAESADLHPAFYFPQGVIDDLNRHRINDRNRRIGRGNAQVRNNLFSRPADQRCVEFI